MRETDEKCRSVVGGVGEWPRLEDVSQPSVSYVLRDKKDGVPPKNAGKQKKKSDAVSHGNYTSTPAAGKQRRRKGKGVR